MSRFPFWKKHPKQESIPPTDPVVLQIKMRTHEAAKQAKKNADKLNKVFEENGITLNIHIAAGGRHGH